MGSEQFENPEQTRISDEDLGIKVPIETPPEQKLTGEEPASEEVPTPETGEPSEPTQEELRFMSEKEAKEALLSTLYERQFKTRDLHSNAVEQIYKLHIDELRSKPTDTNRLIIIKVILDEFPDKKDRELLIEALLDHQKEVLEELETPQMRQIESSGQEHYYPEYQELINQSNKLIGAVEFLEQVEVWLAEAEMSTKERSDDIFRNALTENHHFLIGGKLFQGTLLQALLQMQNDIKYQRSTEGSSERTEDQKVDKREEYVFEILGVINKGEISLLKDRLRTENGYEAQLAVLESLFK
jgi:hypothetical protein